MKKIMLFFFLLFSSFFFSNITVSNAENTENGAKRMTEMIVDREKEEYIRMYNEIYQKSLIQQIEFESEILIPDYIDFKYVEYAYNLANQLGFSTRTVFRLIFKESSFIDTINSPAGANGLMQLMPETRILYRKNLRTDTLNLDKNQEDIYIGLNILKNQYEYWRGRGNSENYSWKLSLATYNAGIVAVNKYKGIPPYKETTDFITFILKTHSNPTFYANILKREKNENTVKISS
ncbi:MAG: lytic transglycosylase domain-containing protein [Candidatus Paceibacterota bacterium]